MPLDIGTTRSATRVCKTSSKKSLQDKSRTGLAELRSYGLSTSRWVKRVANKFAFQCFKAPQDKLLESCNSWAIPYQNSGSLQKHASLFRRPMSDVRFSDWPQKAQFHHRTTASADVQQLSGNDWVVIVLYSAWSGRTIKSRAKRAIDLYEKNRVTNLSQHCSTSLNSPYNTVWFFLEAQCWSISRNLNQ